MVADNHFTESDVEDLIAWLRRKARASTVGPRLARLHFAAEVAQHYLEYRRAASVPSSLEDLVRAIAADVVEQATGARS